MMVQTLSELIELLAASPDEFFIRSDGKYAMMYRSEQEDVVTVEGDFRGSPERVDEALKRAYEEQYPNG